MSSCHLLLLFSFFVCLSSVYAVGTNNQQCFSPEDLSKLPNEHRGILMDADGHEVMSDFVLTVLNGSSSLSILELVNAKDGDVSWVAPPWMKEIKAYGSKVDHKMTRDPKDFGLFIRVSPAIALENDCPLTDKQKDFFRDFDKLMTQLAQALEGTCHVTPISNEWHLESVNKDLKQQQVVDLARVFGVPLRPPQQQTDSTAQQTKTLANIPFIPPKVIAHFPNQRAGILMDTMSEKSFKFYMKLLREAENIEIVLAIQTMKLAGKSGKGEEINKDSPPADAVVPELAKFDLRGIRGHAYEVTSGDAANPSFGMFVTVSPTVALRNEDHLTAGQVHLFNELENVMTLLARQLKGDYVLTPSPTDWMAHESINKDLKEQQVADLAEVFQNAMATFTNEREGILMDVEKADNAKLYVDKIRTADNLEELHAILQNVGAFNDAYAENKKVAETRMESFTKCDLRGIKAYVTEVPKGVADDISNFGLFVRFSPTVASGEEDHLTPGQIDFFKRFGFVMRNLTRLLRGVFQDAPKSVNWQTESVNKDLRRQQKADLAEVLVVQLPPQQTGTATKQAGGNTGKLLSAAAAAAASSAASAAAATSAAAASSAAVGKSASAAVDGATNKQPSKTSGDGGTNKKSSKTSGDGEAPRKDGRRQRKKRIASTEKGSTSSASSFLLSARTSDVVYHLFFSAPSLVAIACLVLSPSLV
eukprot:GHVS01026401.1.p1 GENE.GHVS01026401.1~~GHVS01026401.1.p1  ORF type:complete len:723 (+),score=75.22 GHVS01026401.1:60-2171(+)